MPLKSLHLRNFMCHKNLLVTFDRFTVIGGRNGSGKSAIVAAIGLLLGCRASTLERGKLKELIKTGEREAVIKIKFCIKDIKNRRIEDLEESETEEKVVEMFKFEERKLQDDIVDVEKLLSCGLEQEISKGIECVKTDAGVVKVSNKKVKNTIKNKKRKSFDIIDDEDDSEIEIMNNEIGSFMTEFNVKSFDTLNNSITGTFDIKENEATSEVDKKNKDDDSIEYGRFNEDSENNNTNNNIVSDSKYDFNMNVENSISFTDKSLKGNDFVCNEGVKERIKKINKVCDKELMLEKFSFNNTSSEFAILNDFIKVNLNNEIVTEIKRVKTIDQIENETGIKDNSGKKKYKSKLNKDNNENEKQQDFCLQDEEKNKFKSKKANNDSNKKNLFTQLLSQSSQKNHLNVENTSFNCILDFFDTEIIIERRLTQKNSILRITNEQGNLWSTRTCDLQRLLDCINIDLTNLLNFLTQDTAKHWLMSNNNLLLYSFFENGTGIADMTNLHAKSKERVEETELLIEAIEKEVKKMKYQLQLYQKRLIIIGKIETGKVKMKELQEELKWSKLNLIKPDISTFESLNEQIRELETRQLESNSLINNYIYEKESQSKIRNQKNKELNNKIQKINNEINDLSLEKDEIRNDIDEIKINIAFVKQELVDYEKKSNIEEDEIKNRINGIEKEVDEIKKHIEYFDKLKNSLNNKIVTFDSGLQIKNYQIKNGIKVLKERVEFNKNKMAYFGNDYILMLNEMKSMIFEEPVIGPLASHIFLKESQWYKVAGVVLKNCLAGFIAFSKKDRERILQLIRKYRVKNVNIYIPSNIKVTSGRYRLNEAMIDVPLLNYKSNDSYKTLISIIECNNIIMNQLIILTSLEQIILMTDRSKAYDVMKEKPAFVECAYTINADEIKMVGKNLADFACRETKFYFDKSGNEEKDRLIKMCTNIIEMYEKENSIFKAEESIGIHKEKDLFNNNDEKLQNNEFVSNQEKGNNIYYEALLQSNATFKQMINNLSVKKFDKYKQKLECCGVLINDKKKIKVSETITDVDLLRIAESLLTLVTNKYKPIFYFINEHCEKLVGERDLKSNKLKSYYEELEIYNKLKDKFLDQDFIGKKEELLRNEQNIEGLTKELHEREKRIKDLKNEINLVEKENVQLDFNLDQQIEEERKNLFKFNLRYEQLKKEYTNKQIIFRNKLNSYDTERFKLLENGKEIFTVRLVAEIEKEIVALEAYMKMNMKNEDKEDFLLKANELEKGIKQKSKFLDEAVTRIEFLKDSIELRIKKMEDLRIKIGENAKKKFKYYMSQRMYDGKLIFNHKNKILDLEVDVLGIKNEDKEEVVKMNNTRNNIFEVKTNNVDDEIINVKKDGTEDVLNSTVEIINTDKYFLNELLIKKTGSKNTLSGGERSFSAICLFLSLWPAVSCRLKILDEFDVFMDNANRKTAIKFLIDYSKNKNTQIVLISPLDTCDFFGENCKVIMLEPPKDNQ